jgi:plastocyanin
MISFRTAALASAAVAVLVPAAAQAKTKEMYVGPPTPTAKKLGQTTTANAFFPSKLTVNVGDTVSFVPAGFHSVNVPKKGGAPFSFLAPTGQKAAGVNDAGGAPFWFNGQDQIGPNPAVVASAGFGKSFTYTGAKGIESGLAPEKAKPMKVKFTKAGSYKVYCDIHPGMAATVTVAKKGAKIPTAKQDEAAVKKQADAAVKAAKDLDKTNPGTNVVDLGVAAKGGVEFFGMVPRNLTVAPGTTVKFQMTKGSYEAHTASFGPGNPLTEPTSYLGALAATVETPTIDPRFVYPSDVTPVAVNASLHGNGFWNSGGLDTDKTSPLPESASVKFDTPGTYNYYCLIHPFMVGTVVVQ